VRHAVTARVKKPLYYSRRGGEIVLGSEIKALLAAGVPADLDDAALGTTWQVRQRLWTPVRSSWSVSKPKQRYTWLIQEEVGVKCMWKRWCLATQSLTAGVLWVARGRVPRAV
jgi:asparagine synthetase B (glutamine-hydrolysing)